MLQSLLRRNSDLLMKLLPCFGKTLGWASYRKYHTIHSTFAIYLLQTLWSHRLPALVGQSATADFGLPEPLLFYSVYFSSYTKDFAVTLPLMLRSLAATSRPHHYICVIVICSIFKIKKNSQKKRNDCRQLVACFHGGSVHKRHSTSFRPRLVSVNHCTGYCQPIFMVFWLLPTVICIHGGSVRKWQDLSRTLPSITASETLFSQFQHYCRSFTTWTILWWSSPLFRGIHFCNLHTRDSFL